jgi:predicted amidohydrolase YtcJ
MTGLASGKLAKSPESSTANVQNIHGIGDRANKIILNAIESIIGTNAQAKSEPHFRLEHAQIMRVEDVKRATDLGAIGSYQPTHATSDVSYDFLPRRAQELIG